MAFILLMNVMDGIDLMNVLQTSQPPLSHMSVLSFQKRQPEVNVRNAYVKLFSLFRFSRVILVSEKNNTAVL